MKKKGRIKKIIISILIVLIFVGAIAAGIWYWKQHRTGAVEVQSVSSINVADWFSYDEEGSSGTIVSDVSQSVRVPEDKVVSEVYVEEGDKVKIGDKLLSYDTTLLELDKELQELNVQEIELEIKSAEADLVKLQNTTPVGHSSDDDDVSADNSLLDSDYWSPYDDDDDDDEARVYFNDREMLAVSQEAQTAAEEIIEAGSDDTQPSESGTQEETVPTEAATTEDEDAEQMIGNDETVIENLTPADLNSAGASSESEGYSSIDDAAAAAGDGEEEIEKPKLNQTLSEFLTNVRIKEKGPEGEEILLADTVDQTEEDEPVTAQISQDGITLIPHFKEDAEHQFGKLNTYVLYIKGIVLDEEVSGKSYGTAVIDGEDYPEIGGFTLVQYTRSGAEDVVKLTLAFHDGLEEEQAQALLADMYLEIPLSTEELVSDSLLFRTSEKEADDITIALSLPEAETEEELEEEEEAALNTEAFAGETEAEEDLAEEDASLSEEEILSEVEEDSESSDAEEESESETTQDDTSNGAAISGFYVTVQWNHGTNDRANWPESLTLLFYESELSPDYVYTRTVGTVYNEEGGIQTTTADAEPVKETEATTETEASTDSTETPLSETITDTTDPYSSTQVWSNLAVNWSELGAPKNPNEYYMTVSVTNYIPTIWWDEASGSYSIVMNYLEPEESPLVKLNPLSELDYASGAQGKYYKGSGTKEDPYVFFCTDGAIIRNTFVNWVLGFNELGTERVSDGYYVILEIRESDSITGAFIKSVGLDGTIRVDYGYGPGTYWIFTSDAGIVKYEEDIADDYWDDDGYEYYDPGWEETGDTYTVEELAAAIEAKEKEIRQLKVDEKKANLDLKKYTKELEECNVVSAINGYVKSIGETDDSDAYLVVTSEEGLYLKSTVSELDLDSVEKGQTVSCTSWDTGARFYATITQIDYFPSSTESDYYWGSGNSNSSNYPILAVIEDADGLSEYESVSVTIPTSDGSSTGKIYIEKMYIRSENGQSYVYIADENDLLKKQYIRTGTNSYGMVEIKEGLSENDRIAFPYGKNVKEGAKVVDSSNDEYY